VEALEDLTAAVVLGSQSAYVYPWRAYAKIRLGQIEPARSDCERAFALGPDETGTHQSWGDLHLARAEYDEAINRYEQSAANRDETFWNCELGVALLLAGRLEQAGVVYAKALDGATELERSVALAELEFWTGRQPDRVASPEASQTLSRIRQMISHRKTEAASSAEAGVQ
jgi:tetratricopeptide (TPR) repeat protein